MGRFTKLDDFNWLGGEVAQEFPAGAFVWRPNAPENHGFAPIRLCISITLRHTEQMVTLTNYQPAERAALDAFHAGGGLLFPFRQGYEPLGRLLRDMPQEEWRRDEAVLGGQVLMLVKQGQAPRAKSYMEAADLQFEKTDHFIVLDLLLALHMGEPVSEQKLRRWRQLERSLPIAEPLLMGLYYNAMMAMFVRLGLRQDAKIAGQQAISCFREDGHVYLEHFIHIHLADLNVIEGRLHRAQLGLAAAERCLKQSGLRYGNEDAVIATIRLAIDYERGDLPRVRAKAADLRNSLLNGDSWSELFFQLARIAVLSAYFLEGREAATRELTDFQADYARRHGGDATPMDALQALIWHLEWHPDNAERALDQVRATPMQSSVGDLLLEELDCAMGVRAPNPPETPRDALVGALLKARAARGEARRMALEQAITLAFNEGQIAPFLEHRDLFLGQGATLARSGRLRGRGRLGRMANRVLRLVSESYVVPDSLRAIGFSRRQFRVAAALQSGATNKQIARQLGTTEATVKYHLTSLYRLARVRGRHEFIEFIEEKTVSGETSTF